MFMRTCTPMSSVGLKHHKTTLDLLKIGSRSVFFSTNTSVSL